MFSRHKERLKEYPNIDERWHEVRRLLALPDGEITRNCRELFRDYAESFWPEGHHRHELDAISFAKHLRMHSVLPVEQWRLNLLRFCVAGKRLAVHWVRAMPVRSRWRGGIQVIHRWNRRTAQTFLYLAA